MKHQKIGSCTTILVGKSATIDGSTLIARNEDGSNAPSPQKFMVIPPKEQPAEYHSVISKVSIPLPEDPMRYTSTPDAIDTLGVWAASGINSANVAMTATETITTNSRILAVDPLVEHGIGEEDMVTIVLPYIHSAKDGVERLGALLSEYGTYESNGIAFADQDEIWYLETLGGHHWAAIRIPDNAYVVAPNRLNIDNFDFNSQNTMYSADLPELIEQYHLNPDTNQVNLRHIFGSSTIKDTRYNNPRAWYIQQFFNPEIDQLPVDQDLPFICYANRKITIEDVKWALSAHYENTPFDPYGTGTIAEKKQFRPIGINRNLETHILQIRNNVPKSIAGIHWLAFGPNPFNSIVPFYANINDTPSCYRDTTEKYDPTNIYWLTCTIALIGDSQFDLYSDRIESFELKTMAACRNLQIKADRQITEKADVEQFLQQTNQAMATIYLDNAMILLGDMVASGTQKMNLRFNLKD